MKGKFTIWSFITIAIVLALLFIVDVLQYNLPPYNLQGNSNPAQSALDTCLTNACSARRAAERSACNASGDAANCSSSVSADVSASNCEPSQYPLTGSPAETSIENTYNAAQTSCYAQQ